MFPYHDENATRRTPVVTYALIAANVGAWLLVQGAGAPFPMGEGLVCLTDPGRQVFNVFSSMFLHGSWLHLLGNMWFLWLFGNNIEDSTGPVRYVVFYLACGVAAALLQVFVGPASPIPMVGASGAISGVMGAYLVLYPRVRVYALVPIGFMLTSVALPAWTMLLYWLVLQVLGGVTMLAGAKGGGVAFGAHVGGFVAGLALVKLFARRDYVADRRAHHWRPGHLDRAA
jgi:membrane associated rhomboid family serine protease